MIPAGMRDRRIIFQRPDASGTDIYGDPIEGAVVEVAAGWARVRFGMAQEKREAAQEGGVQAATFELVSTAALRAVKLTDQILFEGSAWDINEAAPLDRFTIRFTATRSR